MEENIGFLQIFVRTANGSLPVPDARITVTGNGEEHILFTDQSGKSERISLPAQPKESSLSSRLPSPFNTYRVTAEKEGFYRQITENVPIFAGIGSLQPITLIGLAEYDSDRVVPGESTDTVRENPQSLDR